jgi:hypothetical protein
MRIEQNLIGRIAEPMKFRYNLQRGSTRWWRGRDTLTTSQNARLSAGFLILSRGRVYPARVSLASGKREPSQLFGFGLIRQSGDLGALLGRGHRPLTIYRGLDGIERSEIQELSVLLPRLSLGSHSEFANLLAVVDVDLYDALGIRRAPALYPSLQVNI